MFFPSGFGFEFSCKPPTGFTTKRAKNASDSQFNSTSIACENATASDKHISWIIVSVLNTGFALTMLVEIIRLCRRFPNCKYTVGWRCDTEFVTVYLLRKQNTRVEIELKNCIDFYKKQVLHPSRTTDVIYGPKTGLDNLYINLVIHTERAKHKFSKNMERHEMFDVYMEVPLNSIRLKEAKDLFYPNQDTNGNLARKILAVGRPGIGKTVLTEKIMRDWANGVDKFYHGKIAFYFKFRWFNSSELKDITLKTFLRYGTELTGAKFERIYEDITKESEKAILTFDGFDEFNGNVNSLDDVPPPNDPNVCMSGISLFIKLISGRLLPEATVLVTSRPTANEFYSRFTFDRTVEIIGFTSDKIEQYVGKFCDNHKRSDLKPRVWDHIKSSSDLLNLCYIPVNSFIVSTVLFESLSDPKIGTGALPTTLTELYNAAIDHFNKHHDRKFHGQSSKEAIEKLQLLAYNGIESKQLLFNDELFDEKMKKSGLLNSLSNPYSQVQTKICFIHLTIQEFLAARHVIETFSPEEIKEFITAHIESGKWHLVLQFVGGLLGKKNCCKDCVFAFTESVIIAQDGTLDLTDNCLVLFVLKCLREVDDEDIVKEACETTAINDVVSLTNTGMGGLYLTSSDWAAVTFVCKHMKKLTRLDLCLYNSNEECYLEVNKLLQQRCVKQLVLVGSFTVAVEMEHLCKTLMESKCALKHEHRKLAELDVRHLYETDERCMSTMHEFFKNGHGSSLEKLSLRGYGRTSLGRSILCEVLDNKLCPELTYLDFSGNSILDEGVMALCNALIKQKQIKLTQLFLDNCLLTDECIPSLCQLLTDKRCNMTDLSLGDNEGVSDEGLRTLCEYALANKHCKLTKLSLFKCSLTDECMPELCWVLQDKHCKLAILSMKGNRGISDKGLRMLCEYALTKEHCKLAELYLDGCSLTDDCTPELCKALQDENCVPDKFWVDGLLTYKLCTATGVKVWY